MAACGILASAAFLGAGASPATATDPHVGSATRAATPAAERALAGHPHHPRTTDQLAPDTAPLQVRISTLSPASLPAQGDVRVTGTVTNRSTETWTGIALYPFFGNAEGTALRTEAQLEAAMSEPYDSLLGERLINVGEQRGDIEELEPGESESFTVTVPAKKLPVTRAGVYWFGVHALGASASAPDDLLADGRARTLIPYVPKRFEDTPLPATLVVPITAPVRYTADGRIDSPETWARWLAPQGRLSRLLGFGQAGSAPLTWLIDPALVDAVGHLARGNPPRNIEPTTPPGETGQTGGTATPGGEATGLTEGAGGGGTGGGSTDAEPVSPEAQAAAAWLDRLKGAVAGDEVLALPYGNIDLPAAVQHDPDLLKLALTQHSAVLKSLGIETRPGVMSPSGYLNLSSVRALDPDTTVIVTDRMIAARGPRPAVASVEGHRLVAASYAVGEGTPGPGPSRTSVGLRQRFLAEAAVRLVRGEQRPLSVVLPQGWGLADAVGFYSGLDTPWLDLGTVGDLEAATTPVDVDPATLDYPALQAQRELDSATFSDVAELISSGDVLQNVLVDNNDIGAVLTEEGLTGLSYSVRPEQASGRFLTQGSQAWVDRHLDEIGVTTSRGVTLAGASGEFSVTISNDLDQAVSVRVQGVSDAGIEITGPEVTELGPQSRTTVVLQARTTDTSVHNVDLVLTDSEGTPLGATHSVPIRSAQVSDVIWLIMGTGAGLLFLAIAVRVVKRLRAARRGEAGDLFATRAERAAESARAAEEAAESTDATDPVEAP